MPSTYSISYLVPLDSSTVMTPSLPTFSITSASKSPISLSLAVIVPTWAICSLSLTSVEAFFNCSTMAAAAFWIPLFSPCDSAPAAIFLKPPEMMAWANKVEVVVPSPQASLVLLAASLTSCTPMFSNGSGSSISLAIVTPSSITDGAPHFLSSATQCPLGPNVTLTASARASLPFFRECLTSSPKIICFAIFLPPYFPGLFGLLRQNIALAENHHFFIIDFDFRAPVLGVNDLVANLEVHGNPLAVIGPFTRTY